MDMSAPMVLSNEGNLFPEKRVLFFINLPRRFSEAKENGRQEIEYLKSCQA